MAGSTSPDAVPVNPKAQMLRLVFTRPQASDNPSGESSEVAPKNTTGRVPEGPEWYRARPFVL